jgi:hypothetical protein
VYQFGNTSDQLNIWLEDYDAFHWFGNGRFDLEIVQLCTPLENQARWQRINEVDNMVLLSEQVASQALLYHESAKVSAFQSFLSAHWFRLLVLSLAFLYLLHIILVNS